MTGSQWAAGGFVLGIEWLEESLAGRLASLREGAAQVVCRQVELQAHSQRDPAANKCGHGKRVVYLSVGVGALLCDELETGSPVVVVAAACKHRPCQDPNQNDRGPRLRGHAPLPLPKYEASQASLNAPMVEAICGVEANICSIMPPQLSLQHSAPEACQSRRGSGAGLLGNALTK